MQIRLLIRLQWPQQRCQLSIQRLINREKKKVKIQSSWSKNCILGKTRVEHKKIWNHVNFVLPDAVFVISILWIMTFFPLFWNLHDFDLLLFTCLLIKLGMLFVKIEIITIGQQKIKIFYFKNKPLHLWLSNIYDQLL